MALPPWPPRRTSPRSDPATPTRRPSSAVSLTSTCWPAMCPSQPGTFRNRLFVRGVSGLVSTTSAIRQASLRGAPATLITPVALLAPRVAVVVVAERLPEARLVFGHELEAPPPFGTLP